MTKNKILSLIQPTGNIHLGNYFGAVRNWVTLQTDYECVYGVADYHAMTAPYNAEKLRQSTWQMVFQLLACGVDPKNLFIQSLIPEHTELTWVLSCVTSFGEMTRMTQFKDKSEHIKETKAGAFVSLGLFDYPVLQAADILIYKADFVPVGKDQEQHLELSRSIAQRFNHQFGVEYFAHPEPLYTKVPKLLSTADPSRKMSKSLGEKHYISLFSDEARIRKQIRSAVTDTGDNPTQELSPGVVNLLTILRATGNEKAYEKLAQEAQLGALKYSELKATVSDALVDYLKPIQQRYEAIISNKKAIKEEIQASSHDIRKQAQQTLKEVRRIVGLPKR